MLCLFIPKDLLVEDIRGWGSHQQKNYSCESEAIPGCFDTEKDGIGDKVEKGREMMILMNDILLGHDLFAI